MSQAHDPLPAILAEMAISNAKGGTINSQSTPATRALLDDAAAAVAQNIPASFEHGGRVFYLRASIGLCRLEVFDSPVTIHPICLAIRGSHATHGHMPGH